MHMQRNAIVLNCKLCCCATEIRVTYSECVTVTLVIHHGVRMRHIFICGLPGYTIFSISFHKRHGFRKTVTEQNVCFEFVTTFV
jgi:hypothetical protein